MGRNNRIANDIKGDIRKPWQINGFPIKTRQTFVAIAKIQNKTCTELLEEVTTEYIHNFIKENTINV